MERFWSKVNKEGPLHPTLGTRCWVWTASVFKRRYGYGQFMLEGQPRYAHRVSYEMANGPIPEGQRVLHHCDNPPCVNPAHLFLGTQLDNVRDMQLKGRSRSIADRHRGKTHCKHGHEFTPENTYQQPSGRGCRACHNAANARWKAKHAA